MSRGFILFSSGWRNLYFPTRSPGGRTVGTAFQQLLWYLIAGTRGGLNRVRILDALRSQPHNTHQLSETLGLDYRTVRHHLELLHRNGLVTQPAGNSYASPYFLSAVFEANLGAFEEIRRRVLPQSFERGEGPPESNRRRRRERP